MLAEESRVWLIKQNNFLLLCFPPTLAQSLSFTALQQLRGVLEFTNNLMSDSPAMGKVPFRSSAALKISSSPHSPFDASLALRQSARDVTADVARVMVLLFLPLLSVYLVALPPLIQFYMLFLA